jgi:hypothetical protein
VLLELVLKMHYFFAQRLIYLLRALQSSTLPSHSTGPHTRTESSFAIDPFLSRNQPEAFCAMLVIGE